MPEKNVFSSSNLALIRIVMTSELKSWASVSVTNTSLVLPVNVLGRILIAVAPITKPRIIFTMAIVADDANDQPPATNSLFSQAWQVAASVWTRLEMAATGEPSDLVR